MYYMMLAIKREYHQAQSIKPVIGQLFDETIVPLQEAAMMKPVIVLDGAPAGIFANHRRNLDAISPRRGRRCFRSATSSRIRDPHCLKSERGQISIRPPRAIR